jgi:hypothetical protein
VDFIRTAFRHLAVWFLLSALVLGFTVWSSRTAETFETKPEATFPGQNFEVFSISPQGEFLAVGRQENILLVRRILTLGSDRTAGERQVILPSRSTQWTVSPDGSQVAWIADRKLTLSKVFGPSPDQPITSPLSENPSLIAFQDNGLLALIFPSGVVKIVEPTKMETRGTEHLSLTDPDTIIAHGSYLAVASRSKRQAEVLDLRGLPKIVETESQTSLPAFSRMVLSAEGRLAFVTLDGAIFSAGIIAGPGVVRAFDFYDDRRFAAGGDFKNLYLIGPLGPPMQVAATVPGISQIVASGTHFAYASPAGTSLVSYHSKPALTSAAKDFLFAWLTLTLLLVLGYLSRGLWLLWDHFGKRRRSGGSGGQIGASLGAFTPPAELLAAIAAGECVLVADEEMSALSGVPRWAEFLRGLADWLVELNLLDREAGNQINTRASKNNVETAWQMLQQTLLDRQDVLWEYAHARYTRMTALSRVHEYTGKVNFGGVITSNLDNLLEKAFQHRGAQSFAPSETEKLIPVFTNNEFFVLRLRGVWARRETIELDPITASNTNRKNLALIRFVETTMLSRCSVFLNLSPEAIGKLLEGVHLNPENAKQHYAVIPCAERDNSIRKACESMQNKFGIIPLMYPPGGTEMVCDFLQKLTEPSGQPLTLAAGV